MGIGFICWGVCVDVNEWFIFSECTWTNESKIKYCPERNRRIKEILFSFHDEKLSKYSLKITYKEKREVKWECEKNLKRHHSINKTNNVFAFKLNHYGLANVSFTTKDRQIWRFVTIPIISYFSSFMLFFLFTFSYRLSFFVVAHSNLLKSFFTSKCWKWRANKTRIFSHQKRKKFFIIVFGWLLAGWSSAESVLWHIQADLWMFCFFLSPFCRFILCSVCI